MKASFLNSSLILLLSLHFALSSCCSQPDWIPDVSSRNFNPSQSAILFPNTKDGYDVFLSGSTEIDIVASSEDGTFPSGSGMKYWSANVSASSDKTNQLKCKTQEMATRRVLRANVRYVDSVWECSRVADFSVLTPPNQSQDRKVPLLATAVMADWSFDEEVPCTEVMEPSRVSVSASKSEDTTSGKKQTTKWLFSFDVATDTTVSINQVVAQFGEYDYVDYAPFIVERKKNRNGFGMIADMSQTPLLWFVLQGSKMKLKFWDVADVILLFLFFNYVRPRWARWIRYLSTGGEREQ